MIISVLDIGCQYLVTATSGGRRPLTGCKPVRRLKACPTCPGDLIPQVFDGARVVMAIPASGGLSFGGTKVAIRC